MKTDSQEEKKEKARISQLRWIKRLFLATEAKRKKTANPLGITGQTHRIIYNVFP